LTAKVSLDRICAFLNTDDAQLINEQQGSKILMDQVCTTWPSREPNVREAGDRVRFELRDITVNIPEAARFILICGPTGAGKVSLQLYIMSVLLIEVMHRLDRPFL
jgi:excinuclease UvrABC ATPase subunit